ncbi:MAG: MFS transporter [Bacteroidales bacterium]|jgi:FHS family glucose/mannose:H+ symporter-like MFS transporter|nr:MFS transporter [Bacteroidales bacterium]MDD2264069.1 MFS transporter [Bacteroidales bacterium]MDD2831303.1 MFS transporter [Bacteroidales bacterium]MDD3208584.1 MFS transporter [Bacteroidales bacterium]MDD3697147.1 MFS transporter [Bacteroidales bacterium]
MKKNKILAAGYAGILFFGISFLTLGSILPSLRDTLDLNMSQSSALAGILPLGVLAGSVVFGPWCDRFGYKMPFQTAAAMVILGFIGLASFRSVPWLGACVLVTGTGGGILNGACNALVNDVSDDSRRSSNLSILGVFYGIGALIMPLILGIFDYVPYVLILRVMAVFLFLIFIYFSLIRFPEAKVRQGFPIKEGLLMLHQPALLFFSFILFFQSALEGLCSNWIPIYLQESSIYGLPQQNALFLLTFVVVGMTVGRILLSWFSLRYAPWKILWAYLFLTAAGFAGLFAGIPPLISVILTGTGLGATFPVIISYIGSRYKALSGTAIGIAMVIALAGNTLLNYLLGFLPIRVFPLYLLSIWAVMTLLYLIMTRKLDLSKNH